MHGPVLDHDVPHRKGKTPRKIVWEPSLRRTWPRLTTRNWRPWGKSAPRSPAWPGPSSSTLGRGWPRWAPGPRPRPLPAPSPGPPPTPSPPDPAQILKTFRKYDTSGDGKVNRDEMVPLLEDLLQGPRGRRTVDPAQRHTMMRLVHKWDLDKDGCLDIKEFVGLVLQVRPQARLGSHPPPHAPPPPPPLPRPPPGRLSRLPPGAAQTEDPTWADDLKSKFLKIDIDRSGTITREELFKSLEPQASRAPPPRRGPAERPGPRPGAGPGEAGPGHAPAARDGPQTPDPRPRTPDRGPRAPDPLPAPRPRAGGRRGGPRLPVRVRQGRGRGHLVHRVRDQGARGGHGRHVRPGGRPHGPVPRGLRHVRHQRRRQHQRQGAPDPRPAPQDLPDGAGRPPPPQGLRRERRRQGERPGRGDGPGAGRPPPRTSPTRPRAAPPPRR